MVNLTKHITASVAQPKERQKVEAKMSILIMIEKKSENYSLCTPPTNKTRREAQCFFGKFSCLDI